MASTMRTALLTPPGHALRGSLVLPGSKSVTNRALLLAALARGRSLLRGALASDDTRYMSEALAQMGVTIARPDATTFTVDGTGRLRQPEGPLFLGNAGTAMRFLTAATAIVDGVVVLDGDAHMRRRPIEPLVAAMRQAGIEASATDRCPPVTVRGAGALTATRFDIDAGLSSQYASALLMVAPLGRAPVDIVLAGADIGAFGYIGLTIAAMEDFGATVTPTGKGAWRVQPLAEGYRARDFDIEPDASAATYFWAAEALTGGAIDLGPGLGASRQPDAEARAVIAQFPHLPPVIDGTQMQDAMPTIAVLAAFNATPVRLTGLANLRVKECDRVAALADGLALLRPDLVRVAGDDLCIAGGLTAPAAAETAIPTRADHRMAMSFALAGLRLKGIRILDSGCVAKTFPDYWQALRSLGAGVEEMPA